jgi:hypothetical protein
MNLFRFFHTVTLAVLPAAPLLAQTAHPRIVATQYPVDDYVVANAIVTEEPYGAGTDGRTDATAAVQKAIDAVAAQGGGVVFLPAGKYRFAGSLHIKEGVTLRGDWLAPGKTARVGGTILMPSGGKGHAEGEPFLNVSRGSGVRNLNIWYPEQNAETPVPYPWTIADDQDHAGNNYTIQQVTLVNSYQGIRFGPKFNELFMVRSVYGTPLKEGMQFDSVTDIGRIAYVRFGPRYWLESGLGTKPDSTALCKYLIQNGTALEMRRSDWQYFYDVAVHGYSRGLYIRRGVQGGSIGVAYNLRATGCDVGLYVEETRFVATNCRFEGRTAAVRTTGEFRDDLQFNSCRLIGTQGSALIHWGSGAVRLVNSHLVARGPGVSAGSGQLTLLNCNLPGANPRIQLARPVERALLIGNHFETATDPVDSTSRGDVQVDHQMVSSPRVKFPEIQIPPDRKPATGKLFNVQDFGARSGKADTTFDNTAAFQSALNAAGRAGGGTVYVPAGFYRLSGHLNVPTGVEMRGVFDVPHHTISLGSVLMATEGRGTETGPAFISLTAGSGLRGLTIWYPEQFVDDIKPYPWTVRSLGPRCWMMDVTTANSYNFADFGSYPSSGHLLRYIAGSPLRRGLWVSKGAGVVDSCQFNPHYWLRRAATAPPLTRTPDTQDLGSKVFNFLTRNHEAFIFGHCPNEIQLNNFVYGVDYGLRFVNDHGATSGWVINHASDGSSEGITVDAAAPEGLNIVSTQIATVGNNKRRAVYVGPHNTGPVNIVGGYSFGQSDVPTMELYGTGPTLVQSWHSKQSEILASGGPKRIESTAFALSLPGAVRLTGAVSRLVLLGNTTPPDVGFNVEGSTQNVLARGNSRPLPPTPLLIRYENDFSNLAPQLDIKPITLQDIENATCQQEPGAGRKGAALVLAGNPDGQAHSLAYYQIADVNLTVKPDTVLRYWLRPESPTGVQTGVDLLFTDGTNLRDSGVVDTNGRNMHPAAPKGAVGYWWKIEGKIGEKLAGKTIKSIVFAFDQGNAKTPVRAAVDRIEIGEPAS